MILRVTACLSKEYFDRRHKSMSQSVRLPPAQTAFTLEAPHTKLKAISSLAVSTLFSTLGVSGVPCPRACPKSHKPYPRYSRPGPYPRAHPRLLHVLPWDLPKDSVDAAAGNALAYPGPFPGSCRGQEEKQMEENSGEKPSC